MNRWGIVQVLLATALLGGAVTVVSAADSDAAIRRQLAQFDRDAGNGNLEGLMALFDDDAVILGPGQAPVVGKPAIRAWWKGILDQFKVDGVHDLGEITTSGDLVILQGKGRGELVPKTGGAKLPIDNWFLHVYRRQADGSVRFWRGAFGPHTPASQPLGVK
jgi:ketosteroid isomerase-like protein